MVASPVATIDELSVADRCLRWAHRPYEADSGSSIARRPRSTDDEMMLQNRVSVCTTLHWPNRLVVEQQSPNEARNPVARWQHASALSPAQRYLVQTTMDQTRTTAKRHELRPPAPSTVTLLPLAEQYGGVVSPVVRYLLDDESVVVKESVSPGLMETYAPLANNDAQSTTPLTTPELLCDDSSLSSALCASSPRVRLLSSHLQWSLPGVEDGACGGDRRHSPPSQHAAVPVGWREIMRALPPLGGYVLPVSSHGESVRFFLSPVSTPTATREDDTTASPQSTVRERQGKVRFVNTALQGTATLRSRWYEYAVRIHLWPFDSGAWARRLYRFQFRLTSQILPVTDTKERGGWDRVNTAAALATLASNPRWSYSIACASSGPLAPASGTTFARASSSVVSVGGAFDSGVQRASFSWRRGEVAASCCRHSPSQTASAGTTAVCYWRWRWTSTLGFSPAVMRPTPQLAEASGSAVVPAGMEVPCFATGRRSGSPVEISPLSFHGEQGVKGAGVDLHSCHTAQLLAEVPLRAGIRGWLRLRLLSRISSSSTMLSNGGDAAFASSTKDNCVLMTSSMLPVASAGATNTLHRHPHAATSLQRYLIRNVDIGLPPRGRGALVSEHRLDDRSASNAASLPSAFLAGSCELQLPLRPFPTLDVCFFVNGLVSFFHLRRDRRGRDSVGDGKQGLHSFVSWLYCRATTNASRGATVLGANTAGGAIDALWSAGVSLVPKRRVVFSPSSDSASHTAATQFRWSKWNEKVGLRMECSWLMFSGHLNHRHYTPNDGGGSSGQISAENVGEVVERLRWLPWRCGVVWDSDAATDDGVA